MVTLCAVDDCTREVAKRQWCRRHYNRWRRYGDPLAGKPSSMTGLTPVERFFLRRTIDDNGCWVIGSTGTYTKLQVGPVLVKTHRWAYERWVGTIPAGFYIDHLCRNPPCANPAHLEAVPPKVNALRGIGPTAVNAVKTHCRHGHEFDALNTVVHSDGRRECRECRNQRSRDHRRKKAAERVTGWGGPGW